MEDGPPEGQGDDLRKNTRMRKSPLGGIISYNQPCTALLLPLKLQPNAVTQPDASCWLDIIYGPAL